MAECIRVGNSHARPGGSPKKASAELMAAAAAAPVVEGWLQRKRKSEWRKTYARLRPDALALFANQAVPGDL